MEFRVRAWLYVSCIPEDALNDGASADLGLDLFHCSASGIRNLIRAHLEFSVEEIAGLGPGAAR